MLPLASGGASPSLCSRTARKSSQPPVAHPRSTTWSPNTHLTSCSWRGFSFRVATLPSTRWQRLQPPRVSYASLRESKREIGADENPRKRRRRLQGSNMRRPGTKKKVNIHTSTATSKYCVSSRNIKSYISLCVYALLSCSGQPGAGQEGVYSTWWSGLMG